MARWIISLLTAAMTVMGPCSAPAGAAPDGERPRVVLAVDGIEQTRNLPVLVAERLHYFQQEGLTVTLVDAPADPTPSQLVGDGRADGAVAFYHHTFMDQVDDHRVTQAVVVMGATPQLKLIVASRLEGIVHDVAGLKGRRIFVGGSNSGKTTTMTWLAARAGFAPADYQALPLASRAAMAAALRDGTADAIVAHEPDAGFYVASKAGFQMLDLTSVAGTRTSLGGIFPSTALYLPTAFVASRPEVTQHLVNALLKAMRYIAGHSAEQIAAVLPDKTGGSDRAAYLRLLTEDKAAFATDGRMAPQGARDLLTAMAAIAPKYRSVRIDETWTNTFVDRATR